MSPKELTAKLAELQKENDALKARVSGSSVKISFKVSAKGCLSVYGLGRFPVSLYRQQWERLLSDENVKAVRGFIKANEASLTVK